MMFPLTLTLSHQGRGKKDEIKNSKRKITIQNQKLLFTILH
jgi:hypothetical protein